MSKKSQEQGLHLFCNFYTSKENILGKRIMVTAFPHEAGRRSKPLPLPPTLGSSESGADEELLGVQGPLGPGMGQVQQDGPCGRWEASPHWGWGARYLGVWVCGTSHPCDLGTPSVWVSEPLSNKVGDSVRAALLSSVTPNRFLSM